VSQPIAELLLLLLTSIVVKHYSKSWAWSETA